MLIVVVLEDINKISFRVSDGRSRDLFISEACQFAGKAYMYFP